MNRFWDALNIAAAVGCGLMAGVLFAFSAFVIAGLDRLPGTQGLQAMNSINVTAVRPPLMIGLFGTAALCLALLVRIATRWSVLGGSSGVLVAVGSAVYLLGVIGLTAAYNVPLNDHLAAVPAHATDALAQWRTYRHNWAIANHFRVIAALVSAVLLILGRTA